jgi:hypothetical protein
VLPEAGHNQVVVLAGGFGSLAGAADEDIFRDRVEEAAPWPRMRVLLVRDPDELPGVARKAATVHAVAERHGVPSSELTGEGERPLDRLGRMVALTDFASVYLALMQGIDPTPIEPIVLLKAGSAERTGDDR